MKNEIMPWLIDKKYIVPILLSIIFGLAPIMFPLTGYFLLVCWIIVEACVLWLTAILIKTEWLKCLILILIFILLTVYGFFRVREQWEKDHKPEISTLHEPILFAQNFPGISFHSLIKLNDINKSRRKYIADFGHINGSRLSVYVSADNIFTFSFTDTRNEPHLIQIPIGNNGVPFSRAFYLICELGIDGQSTLLRMLIDGKEINSLKLSFKVDIGDIDVLGGIIGADLNGENGASFDMGNMIVFSTTMISSQIKDFTNMALSNLPNQHFVNFNGKKWLQVKNINKE